jgi:hypothetical protein
VLLNGLDIYIWNNCQLSDAFETGKIQNGWHPGDTGYSFKPWFLKLVPSRKWFATLPTCQPDVSQSEDMVSGKWGIPPYKNLWNNNFARVMNSTKSTEFVQKNEIDKALLSVKFKSWE